MCGSSPKAPPAPVPPAVLPEKQIDLNPRRKKVNAKNAKKSGTRGLQIPLGGTKGSSGLSTPG